MVIVWMCTVFAKVVTSIVPQASHWTQLQWGQECIQETTNKPRSRCYHVPLGFYGQSFASWLIPGAWSICVPTSYKWRLYLFLTLLKPAQNMYICYIYTQYYNFYIRLFDAPTRLASWSSSRRKQKYWVSRKLSLLIPKVVGGNRHHITKSGLNLFVSHFSRTCICPIIVFL